jgi:hypothetical protein
MLISNNFARNPPTDIAIRMNIAVYLIIRCYAGKWWENA